MDLRVIHLWPERLRGEVLTTRRYTLQIYLYLYLRRRTNRLDFETGPDPEQKELRMNVYDMFWRVGLRIERRWRRFELNHPWVLSSCCYYHYSLSISQIHSIILLFIIAYRPGEASLVIPHYTIVSKQGRSQICNNSKCIRSVNVSICTRELTTGRTFTVCASNTVVVASCHWNVCIDLMPYILYLWLGVMPISCLTSTIKRAQDRSKWRQLVEKATLIDDDDDHHHHHSSSSNIRHISLCVLYREIALTPIVLGMKKNC